MKIFGVLFSPFVRKAYLVAAEKGVTVEAGTGGPGNPTDEFVAASPFRKIPAMIDGDYSLCDSTAIAAYLDAKYPEPALYPADPRLRGKAVWFEEYADTIIPVAALPILRNRFVLPKFMGIPGDEAQAVAGEEALAPMLDWLEQEVPAEGWLVGEAFSIADIAVATAIKTLSYVSSPIEPSSRPKTAAWYDRVCARPAWQQVAAIEG
ncbi:MAG: glutathione S-transferase family protein [Novosphingobium sp.]